MRSSVNDSASPTTVNLPGPASALACGPGGWMAAATPEGTVAVAQLSTPGIPTPPAWPHPDPVSSIAVGSDGLVATARNPSSGGAGVSLWSDGVELGFIPHPAPVTMLAIRSDGALMGTACDDGQVRIWRIAPASSELRFGRYDADAPRGEDLLGIAPTVNALGALVAARQTEPPLSIGLFGPWGSGKTFFMHKLRQRIEEISSDAAASEQRQADLWAWRNVQQIWFNAWNYAAADVWAGLVEHLLRALRDGISDLPTPGVFADMQLDAVRALAEADTEHRSAVARVQSAEAEASEASELVQTAREELETALTAEEEAQKALESALEQRAPLDAGLEEALKKVGVNAEVAALPEALREASVDAALWRARLAAGNSETEKSQRRWLAAGTVAIPALVVGVAAGAHALHWQLSGLIAAAAGVASGVNGLALWLRRQASWMEEDVKTASDSFADAQAKRIQKAGAFWEAQRTSARHGAKLRERQGKLREKELAKLEAQRKAERTSPGQVFSDYLGDRVASDDYRSRLGVLGLVRRDIDAISDAVTTRNAELAKPGAKKGDSASVNRIILYIDDLDRCPPRVVVKVLEAVHLLLAYPLFVVVVAVDPEWVRRSIAKRYRGLFDTGGVVSPDEYLEKIFQLPIWLEPLRDDTAKRMLTGLLEADGGTGGDGRPRESTEATPAEQPAPPDGAPTGIAAATGNGTGPRENLAESPPTTLELSAEEQSGITGLAPLLTRSPRAVKRYLNTYRLLKAETDPEDLRALQALLALGVNRDDGASRLLEIETSPRDLPLKGLLPEGRDKLIAELLTRYVRPEATAGEVAPLARRVRRYMFRRNSDAIRAKRAEVE